MIEIGFFICTFQSMMIGFLKWGTVLVLLPDVCMLFSHSNFFYNYGSFFLELKLFVRVF